MKENIIHNWDCIEILKNEIMPWTISLIFADPPYNLSWKSMKLTWNKTWGDWEKVNEERDTIDKDEYITFTNNRIWLCNNALKDGWSIYISATYHNMWEVLLWVKKHWLKIQNLITENLI